jgi:hypothetical protein
MRSTDVCYWVQSGHRADMKRCPLFEFVPIGVCFTVAQK